MYTYIYIYIYIYTYTYTYTYIYTHTQLFIKTTKRKTADRCHAICQGKAKGKASDFQLPDVDQVSRGVFGQVREPESLASQDVDLLRFILTG